MESSPIFNAPKPTTDEKGFVPIKNLPEHLEEYAHISREAREHMTSPLSSALVLTDLAVLRSAAVILDEEKGSAVNDEKYKLAA